MYDPLWGMWSEYHYTLQDLTYSRFLIYQNITDTRLHLVYRVNGHRLETKGYYTGCNVQNFNTILDKCVVFHTDSLRDVKAILDLFI